MSREFITSPILQGFDCLADCPGTLDLWMDQDDGSKILICSECEASWEVEESTTIDQSFFKNNLNWGLNRKYIGDVSLFRILDHRLFITDAEDFPELILEAWNQRNKTVGESSRQFSVIVPMGRIVGKKGESWINVQYDFYADQIVDLEPIYY